jgi:hypothetical protein
MVSLPTQCISIVADAIRQEAGGKVSLLGVFADGRIVVSVGSSLPLVLPLAFYFLFTDGEGSFDGKLRVLSPTSKVLFDLSLGKQTKHKGQPMTTSVALMGLSLPEWGDYQAILTLDDRRYVRGFSLAAGLPPSAS